MKLTGAFRCNFISWSVFTLVAAVDVAKALPGPVSPNSEVCTDFLNLYPEGTITDLGDEYSVAAENLGTVAYSGYRSSEGATYAVVIFNRDFSAGVADPDFAGAFCWEASYSFLEGTPPRKVFNKPDSCYSTPACRTLLQPKPDQGPPPAQPPPVNNVAPPVVAAAPAPDGDDDSTTEIGADPSDDDVEQVVEFDQSDAYPETAPQQDPFSGSTSGIPSSDASQNVTEVGVDVLAFQTNDSPGAVDSQVSGPADEGPAETQPSIQPEATAPLESAAPDEDTAATELISAATPSGDIGSGAVDCAFAMPLLDVYQSCSVESNQYTTTWTASQECYAKIDVLEDPTDRSFLRGIVDGFMSACDGEFWKPRPNVSPTPAPFNPEDFELGPRQNDFSPNSVARADVAPEASAEAISFDFENL